jgi:hypothetical protein
MPRQGTSARKREREGKAEVKPGRIGWVRGTKLVFFRGFQDDFIQAAEISKVEAGKFYDNVTAQYLKKYGYNTPYDGDLRDDQDVASDVDEDEDVNTLPAEEGEVRSAYYDEVRTIRIWCCTHFHSIALTISCRQKIAFWFRTEYGGAIKTTKKGKKAKIPTFKEIFDHGELGPVRPARPRIVNFYLNRCYEERIKARFEAKWALVKDRPMAPASITVQNEVIREAWRAETPAFKAEIVEALEKEHQANLDAYEVAMSGDPPTTPEGFQM